MISCILKVTCPTLWLNDALCDLLHMESRSPEPELMKQHVRNESFRREAFTAVWNKSSMADMWHFLLTLPLAQAVTLNEDVLRSSATELSDGLCCFITEAKRPNGEPYSPDGLFYLCLSIQQARWATLHTVFTLSMARCVRVCPPLQTSVCSRIYRNTL